MAESRFTLEQLEASQEVGLVLSEPGDIVNTLEGVLKILDNKLNLKHGMISVFQRDLQELHVQVTHGMESDDVGTPGRIRYALGEGITGKVAQTGRPIAVPSVDKEPMFLDRTGRRRKLDRGDVAFVCVPVKYGKEVAGTLSVSPDKSGEAGDFEGDIRFLEIIARLIASYVSRLRMREENERLKGIVSHHAPLGSIVGNSDVMRGLALTISQVADSRTTILITGETGTGKELVAHEIHRLSSRKNGQFVAINCGAIPENLIESELFGHEKGAFTGAVGQRTGRFELANGGTIFLDEIGELPLAAQVKLLRVLQEREFERVGGAKTIRINVRVIAATNRDIKTFVDDGRFRDDLYYRLSVFPIHVPPLRERGADVMLLADHFVEYYAREVGKEIRRIDTPAIDMLMAYHWPGNVRELENCIERAVLLSQDGVIHGHHLPPSLQMKKPDDANRTRGKFKQLAEAYERELITDALKDARGNQTIAAKLLGTTKRVIQYKVNVLGIDYKRFRR